VPARATVILQPVLLSAAGAAFALGDLSAARLYAEDARLTAEQSARGADPAPTWAMPS